MFKFKINTYSYDSSGYYIGRDDWLEVTLSAESTTEAKKKALALREGERMKGTHNAWGAVVIEAEEVVEPLPGVAKETK